LASRSASAAEQAARVSPLAALLSAPGMAWPGPAFYASQLYYPDWLFGEWTVSSTLTAFSTPRGERYAPRNARAAASADLGRPVVFTARFYATLPDDRANALRVALGSLPQSRVVADRAFNAGSLANATAALMQPPGSPPAVRSVEYDPRNSPVLLKVAYAGGATATLSLSAMRSDDGEGPLFYTAECSRQSSADSRGGAASDYQIVCGYERLAEGRVVCRQRVGVFLTPIDEAYFETANTAVALYDYTLDMSRVATAATDGPLTCVETPKAVTQCR